jgi:hypothetical protein
MLVAMGEAFPLYVVSENVYSGEVLMKGSSLLDLGTVVTICLVGGFSSTPSCPCLMDGVTRSLMNTLARTSAWVDPNFDGP